MTEQERFMKEAVRQAKKAAALGEVPIGCVITLGDRIVGRGRNRRELGKNALAHAEIEAIKKAAERLGGWHLDDCELYVTLEPCPMCAGAIINSRIKKVVFGAFEPKSGACSSDSVVNLFGLPFNHSPEVYGGICEKECAEIMTKFFKDKR